MSSHRFVRREERQSRGAEADQGPAKRYWPGRAPDWYKEDQEQEAEQQDVQLAADAPTAFGKLAVKDEPEVAAPSIVRKASCPCHSAQSRCSDSPGPALTPVHNKRCCRRTRACAVPVLSRAAWLAWAAHERCMLARRPTPGCSGSRPCRQSRTRR